MAPNPLQQNAATLLHDWQVMMRDQLRLSPHTVSAYGRDTTAFIEFLKDHLGHEPQGADFTDLHLRDLRAFMAARRATGGAHGAAARYVGAASLHCPSTKNR